MTSWLDDDAWVARHLDELGDQRDRDRRKVDEWRYTTQREMEDLGRDVTRLSRLLQLTWIVLVVAWAFF